MPRSHPAVHFGFEVDTGKPVAIPIRHMVVTGQTQEAGKTTALDALISRSGLRALAFLTKRGEGAFASSRSVPPYFRERADWQFVAALLEATLREKLKFERAWIVRASKGARSLAEVQRNVRTLMESSKGLSADVYLMLDEYLSIVVPQIEMASFAERIELEPGLNVMPLVGYSSELQALVIRSALEWIYVKERDTIAILPEAWEFIPQQRGSPVKLAAEELIRKGAGLRNYVWLDSQDIAAVHKDVLRSVPVWVLGVQREANEIKRLLAHIPQGISKPKPAQIMALELGEFFVCHGQHVIRAYAQPAWMSHEEAQAVATGARNVNDTVAPPAPTPVAAPRPRAKEDPTVKESEARELREAIDKLKAENARLVEVNAALHRQLTASPETVTPTPAPGYSIPASFDEDALLDRVIARIRRDPVLLQLAAAEPELEVRVQRHTITVDDSTVLGRTARLLAGGFMETTRRFSEIMAELNRTGARVSNNKPLSVALKQLVAQGFLTKEGDEGYRAAPGMKARIVEG